MTTRAFLLAIAIALELLAVYLFRSGGQPAVAAALLVIGLTALIVALTAARPRSPR